MLKKLAIGICFLTGMLGFLTGVGYIILGNTPEIERATHMVVCCGFACLLCWAFDLFD